MEQSTPVMVARIAKPHGIHGEVVLDSFTDVEGRLENTDLFLLMNHGAVVRELKVESRRFFGGRFVMQFAGIPDRTEAEKIRGMELAVPQEEIGSLPENQFFVHELVGMSVHLMDGRHIGTVKSVMRAGGVDLLEIGERGQILIPFSEPICVEVDMEKRQITVNPPEGLLQLNES